MNNPYITPTNNCQNNPYNTASQGWNPRGPQIPSNSTQSFNSPPMMDIIDLSTPQAIQAQTNNKNDIRSIMNSGTINNPTSIFKQPDPKNLRKIFESEDEQIIAPIIQPNNSPQAYISPSQNQQFTPSYNTPQSNSNYSMYNNTNSTYQMNTSQQQTQVKQNTTSIDFSKYDPLANELSTSIAKTSKSNVVTSNIPSILPSTPIQQPDNSVPMVFYGSDGSVTPQQPYMNSNFTPQSNSNYPQQPNSNFTSQPSSSFPQQPNANFTSQPSSSFPQKPNANFTQQPNSSFPQQPNANFTQQPNSSFPQQPNANFTQQPNSSFPQQPNSGFVQSNFEPQIPTKSNYSQSNQFLNDFNQDSLNQAKNDQIQINSDQSNQFFDLSQSTTQNQPSKANQQQPSSIRDIFGQPETPSATSTEPQIEPTFTVRPTQQEVESSPAFTFTSAEQMSKAASSITPSMDGVTFGGLPLDENGKNNNLYFMPDSVLKPVQSDAEIAKLFGDGEENSVDPFCTVPSSVSSFGQSNKPTSFSPVNSSTSNVFTNPNSFDLTHNLFANPTSNENKQSNSNDLTINPFANNEPTHSSSFDQFKLIKNQFTNQNSNENKQSNSNDLTSNPFANNEPNKANSFDLTTNPFTNQNSNENMQSNSNDLTGNLFMNDETNQTNSLDLTNNQFTNKSSSENSFDLTTNPFPNNETNKSNSNDFTNNPFANQNVSENKQSNSFDFAHNLFSNSQVDSKENKQIESNNQTKFNPFIKDDSQPKNKQDSFNSVDDTYDPFGTHSPKQQSSSFESQNTENSFMSTENKQKAEQQNSVGQIRSLFESIIDEPKTENKPETVNDSNEDSGFNPFGLQKSTTLVENASFTFTVSDENAPVTDNKIKSEPPLNLLDDFFGQPIIQSNSTNFIQINQPNESTSNNNSNSNELNPFGISNESNDFLEMNQSNDLNPFAESNKSNASSNDFSNVKQSMNSSSNDFLQMNKSDAFIQSTKINQSIESFELNNSSKSLDSNISKTNDDFLLDMFPNSNETNQQSSTSNQISLFEFGDFSKSENENETTKTEPKKSEIGVYSDGKSTFTFNPEEELQKGPNPFSLNSNTNPFSSNPFATSTTNNSNPFASNQSNNSNPFATSTTNNSNPFESNQSNNSNNSFDIPNSNPFASNQSNNSNQILNNQPSNSNVFESNTSNNSNNSFDIANSNPFEVNKNDSIEIKSNQFDSNHGIKNEEDDFIPQIELDKSNPLESINDKLYQIKIQDPNSLGSKSIIEKEPTYSNKLNSLSDEQKESNANIETTEKKNQNDLRSLLNLINEEETQQTTKNEKFNPFDNTKSQKDEPFNPFGNSTSNKITTDEPFNPFGNLNGESQFDANSFNFSDQNSFTFTIPTEETESDQIEQTNSKEPDQSNNASSSIQFTQPDKDTLDQKRTINSDQLNTDNQPVEDKFNSFGQSQANNSNHLPKEPIKSVEPLNNNDQSNNPNEEKFNPFGQPPQIESNNTHNKSNESTSNTTKSNSNELNPFATSNEKKFNPFDIEPSSNQTQSDENLINSTEQKQSVNEDQITTEMSPIQHAKSSNSSDPFSMIVESSVPFIHESNSEINENATNNQKEKVKEIVENPFGEVQLTVLDEAFGVLEDPPTLSIDLISRYQQKPPKLPEFVTFEQSQAKEMLANYCNSNLQNLSFDYLNEFLGIQDTARMNLND